MTICGLSFLVVKILSIIQSPDEIVKNQTHWINYIICTYRFGTAFCVTVSDTNSRRLELGSSASIEVASPVEVAWAFELIDPVILVWPLVPSSALVFVVPVVIVGTLSVVCLSISGSVVGTAGAVGVSCKSWPPVAAVMFASSTTSGQTIS
jgi:hypothetical protein